MYWRVLGHAREVVGTLSLFLYKPLGLSLSSVTFIPHLMEVHSLKD